MQKAEGGEEKEGGRKRAEKGVEAEMEGVEGRGGVAEAGREGAAEEVVREIERGERREQAEGRGEGAGEAEGGEVEGDDAAGEGVAGESGPGGAVRIGREPGGEGTGGVMEAGAEEQESGFVLRVDVEADAGLGRIRQQQQQQQLLQGGGGGHGTKPRQLALEMRFLRPFHSRLFSLCGGTI